MLGGVGVFFASFMTDWNWVTPAWVQAVGTVGAIVVAFWIGHSDRRRDNADRRLKARSLALALYPEFMELTAKREKALKYLARGFHNHRVVQQYDLMKKGAALKIPPVLSESVDRLYLLGDEVGPNMQQILAFSTQYNRMVNAVVNDLKKQASLMNVIGKIIKKRKPVEVGVLNRQLKAIGNLIEETEEGLGKIHDG